MKSLKLKPLLLCRESQQLPYALLLFYIYGYILYYEYAV